MNAVGIDVSKGKSTVCILRPLGEVVREPFELPHTEQALQGLLETLLALPGQTRVVMEYTSNYHASLARTLHEAGLFVSVVNPILVRHYGAGLRRAKTDRKDALKLAAYALDRWQSLPRYCPEEDTRMALKAAYRQYQQTVKLRTTMKNNLIALLDLSFPGLNLLFSGAPRLDGREKWVDFAATFWHCETVCGQPLPAFTRRYARWCERQGYRYDAAKAASIYDAASAAVCLPRTETAELLVRQAAAQLQAVSAAATAMRQEMQRLAQKLPEYAAVMSMYGVGPTLGPQLMAEIGDVRRFHSKKALVAFAGIDAPPYQSGTIDVHSRSISKRGSPSLRRTLFLVMTIFLQTAPEEEPVYRFLDKKRAEGKPYKVYMMAAANKFLRIYYATVKNTLPPLDPPQDG